MLALQCSVGDQLLSVKFTTKYCKFLFRDGWLADGPALSQTSSVDPSSRSPFFMI